MNNPITYLIIGIILVVLTGIVTILTILFNKEYDTIKGNKFKILTYISFFFFVIIPFSYLFYLTFNPDQIDPKLNLLFIKHTILIITIVTYLSIILMIGLKKIVKTIIIIQKKTDVKIETISDKQTIIEDSILKLQFQINKKADDLSYNIGEVKQLKEDLENSKRNIKELQFHMNLSK